MMLFSTTHTVINGDSTQLPDLIGDPVQLILTSPPYWNLKKYEGDHEGQLGDIEDYAAFRQMLKGVWQGCFDRLEVGCRLVVVVGDVCLPRRTGRHHVIPLHSHIVCDCENIGFDVLTPIVWHKFTNAAYESDAKGRFFGTPYQPNGIIKNEAEFILIFRKPGGYRSPSPQQKEYSVIPKDSFVEWFRQIWTIPGASNRNHPAPFPRELARRIIRMFSFVGDTVLDPFVGSGTIMWEAASAARNSIGIDISEKYCDMAWLSLGPNRAREASIETHHQEVYLDDQG